MDGSYSHFVNSVADLKRDNGKTEVPCTCTTLVQRWESAIILPGDGGKMVAFGWHTFHH